MSKPRTSKEQADAFLRDLDNKVRDEIEALRLDYPDLLIAGGMSWDIVAKADWLPPPVDKAEDHG